VLFATPLAFLVSLVGVLVEKKKRFAIAGLAISGCAGLFFFGLPILLRGLMR